MDNGPWRPQPQRRFDLWGQERYVARWLSTGTTTSHRQTAHSHLARGRIVFGEFPMHRSPIADSTRIRGRQRSGWTACNQLSSRCTNPVRMDTVPTGGALKLHPSLNKKLIMPFPLWGAGALELWRSGEVMLTEPPLAYPHYIVFFNFAALARTCNGYSIDERVWGIIHERTGACSIETWAGRQLLKFSQRGNVWGHGKF